VCSGTGTNFWTIATTGNLGAGEQLGGAQGGPVCQTPAGTATISSITAPSGGVSTLTISGTPTVGVNAGSSLTMQSGYGTVAMSVRSLVNGTGNGNSGTQFLVNNSNTGSFSGSATATVAATSVFGWVSANVSGGQGVGSEWTIDSGGLPPNLYLAGPATCTNLSMWAVSSNTYVWQGNADIRHISSLTIRNNYVDGSSSWVPRDGQVDVFYYIGGNGVNFNGTISGTALTYNSGTVPSVGQYVVGAGIAGCTADPTTCPTIASGTSPHFVLSASGGTVGPEAMSGELPTVCGIPSVVSGNVDMSGVANSTTMNPNFSAATFSVGC
jgi:hypothetical protein